VRTRSAVRPFERFLHAVEIVLAALPFRVGATSGAALVEIADARHLPRRSESVDLVVTSPPYLNAIDYLRCHKFSLVWMGHSIQELRGLRAANVGSEVGAPVSADADVESIVGDMITERELPPRYRSMLRRYVIDMGAVLSEIARVLVPRGKATLVVGESTLRGSTALRRGQGLSPTTVDTSRPLPMAATRFTSGCEKRSFSRLRKTDSPGPVFTRRASDCQPAGAIGE
jgi:hypothetical protein